MQKDVLRDFLRVAADKTKQTEGLRRGGGENGLLERAGAEESLLHQNVRKPAVMELPEKLVTYSMAKKEAERHAGADAADGPWHGNLFHVR